jgi:hypothetical protein
MEITRKEIGIERGEETRAERKTKDGKENERIVNEEETM